MIRFCHREQFLKNEHKKHSQAGNHFSDEEGKIKIFSHFLLHNVLSELLQDLISSSRLCLALLSASSLSTQHTTNH